MPSNFQETDGKQLAFREHNAAGKQLGPFSRHDQMYQSFTFTCEFNKMQQVISVCFLINDFEFGHLSSCTVKNAIDSWPIGWLRASAQRLIVTLILREATNVRSAENF